MMERRLTGFLAIIAFMVHFLAWSIGKVAGWGVVDAETALTHGLCVFFPAIPIGYFVSRLGVRLVQEVLEERRIREDERRGRARQRYEQILGDDMEEALASQAEAPAAGGAAGDNEGGE